MQISYRSYPYPVLSHFTDDYVKCAFQANVKVSSTKNTYLFKSRFALSDKKLKEMIEIGEAKYALHVECKSTRYRQIHPSSDSKIEVKIPIGLMSGTVEICCIVVAAKEISDYSNQNFHEEFGTYKFNVQKGDVLAVAQDRAFEVDSYLDLLKKTPSIFSISVNKMDNSPPIDFDYGNTKINILLTNDTFEKYRYLKVDTNLQKILASMIIIPVLVEILTEMKANITEFHENNVDARWFKSIKHRLSEIGYAVETDKFEIESAVKLAHLMLEDPLSSGIACLDGIMEESE